MRSSNLQNILLLMLVIILWASAYVGIREGLHGYSPGCLALLRYLIASVFMVAIYLHKGSRKKPNLAQLVVTAVSGILGFAVYNVALNSGEISVSAGIASFIICQSPVIMTLLAIFFFNERLLLLGWFGTVISLLGILLIAFGEKGTTTHIISFGVFYILIAAVAGALYSILQKQLLKKIDPIDFTAFAIWFGTIAMLFYFPELLHELPKAPLTSTIAVIYMGIFPAAIAYLLWGYILQKMPVAKAGSCIYIIPLCTMFLGWLLLREIPSWISMSGGLLALLGALFVHKGTVASLNKIKM
jgi:drug/metabolite transporter (DMT)-like permease